MMVIARYPVDHSLKEAIMEVELKSIRRVIKAHEVQLVKYLVATKNDVGLILNFVERGVEVKRKVRTLK